MKIRLYQDSVRLRVSPSEMQDLVKNLPIAEKFSWGDKNSVHPLSFHLIPSEITQLKTGETQGTYLIEWSKALINEWANSEETGMYHTFSVKGGINMSVAIEKDFACKGRDDENKADRFPNPNQEVC